MVGECVDVVAREVGRVSVGVGRSHEYRGCALCGLAESSRQVTRAAKRIGCCAP